MTNCNECEKTKECRYTNILETCLSCKFDTMFFDPTDLNADPCNTCFQNSNYVAFTDDFNDSIYNN